MGEALDGLGRTPEAIAEFEAAAKISPREPNVYFGLGYLYWKQREFDNAEPEFRLELKNDPNHALAEAYLGDIAMRRQESKEARRLLEDALRSRRNLRIASFDLGIINTQEKRYADAVSDFKEAIRADPARSDAHYRLALAYQAMGRPQDAAAERRLVFRMQEKTQQDLLHKISGPPPAALVQ